jgi:hypothetical protein
MSFQLNRHPACSGDRDWRLRRMFLNPSMR